MSSPVLTIEGLDVALADGSRTIVRAVNLAVHEGQTVCVVGESGSGKSVTSLAVMGLLPADSLRPTAGIIRLDGENLLAATSGRLRELRASKMAMIFQEPMTALNPVQTVGRQIDEVLRAHTRLDPKARRQKILAMMEEVRLPDVERVYRSYPHGLSGGQRQRIMIAMALILNPRLLIADEPTTALDVTTQKQILALIRELSAEHGTAVLFITHDMGVVADIADEVVVMRRGEVVERGVAPQVLAKPAVDYTRNLLKSVPSLIPRPKRLASDNKELLRTAGLTKTYRRRPLIGKAVDVHAARQVDLVVYPGRTLGIVGESGSGKSTVARCIVRLIDPSDGSISLLGDEIGRLGRRQLKPYRQKIQIVFQDPYRSLNPRLRVGASLIEGPTNFGAARDQALHRARELLELVGLPADAIDRYPHQFSGGQRQRIAIARALMMEPVVLIADEAVSALDVSVQAQVLKLLADVQERLGLGMLFITHDLRVAAQICDEVVVMHKGEIVEHGAAADVLSRPQAAYTQELVAAAPGRHWNFATFSPVEPASLGELHP